ncbi:inner membrane localized protein [Parasponia andersonii]|uniref:Inner membrane localized protein n=1 Tax=Parasponia andersonii TaxID=3476 RepID=A0A2P5A985_PARAD|nr:inner membrane localized protein [Parasponia andersonii]
MAGSPLKRSNQYLGTANLSFNSNRTEKSQLSISRKSISVQAAYSDGGRPSSASIFIGGFVLGGIIVGTLGCVYAPQISKALTGTDRKDLMRKLPKFIYDEEKALEKTRKVLAEKIAQLNSAIDDVSAQLRSEDGPNGVAVSSDEIEATI